ncbi:primosomal protein N' [Microbacterium paludicola]|uniref:Primosomal protein N n=1 Tax=Microbacterium paludicola TaxID=300019 RepID=A0A4Y9FXE0_9MICO|nr:primosomal protein N' [Microbacterium paludicola]MBF0815389.1 primosomal protein N' [Microbacterium paludicola]TFU33930.1 primosomal protein N' [Microbacterium paludicola]
MSRRVARVLIDSPLPQLDRLFDYAIPDELAGECVPGVRIKAPLRTAGRVVDGYVVEIGDEADGDRPLSELDSVVSAAEVLPPRLYALARRVADRAAGSAVDILRLAIPKRQVRVEKQWLAGDPPPAPVVPQGRVEAAHALLAAYPGLAEGLEESGRLAVDAPPRLEGARPAWTALISAAATVVLAAGRSVVLVVPDHRDLDALHGALLETLPADAVVRHDAQQTGPERYRGFLRTLADAPCVVIGNRSAVYSPVARLGLIALWDDGDPLYEEQLAPYVHARDAALVRQELADPDSGETPALLLAGHTRTADVERLVALGWVRDVPAARRYAPNVILSALNESERPGARIPSAAFRAAREGLEHGPVLVQVARPGYAPTLVCADCRAPARCRHCGGPLHAPGRGATPVCGWCGRSATAWTCAACSSPRVRLASSGSERTADELGRAFPGARVIVADNAHPVLEVDDRPALVVATRGAEPIAQGGYRAVLLLDGDRMLQAPELRIGEACLRWWSNAAALAAPGAPVHLVGVGGAVGRALATWTQAAYARAELADRAPLRMPPTARVARIEGDVAAVDRALATLRADVPELPADAVLGPVPLDRQGWPGARALIRFDYSRGAAVAASLRASVVTEAVNARSSRRGSAKSRAPRNILTARLDIVEPEL